MKQLRDSPMQNCTLTSRVHYKLIPFFKSSTFEHVVCSLAYDCKVNHTISAAEVIVVYTINQFHGLKQF